MRTNNPIFDVIQHTSKKCKWLAKALKNCESLNFEQKLLVGLYMKNSTNADFSAFVEYIKLDGLIDDELKIKLDQMTLEPMKHLSCNHISNMFPRYCEGCINPELKIISPLLIEYHESDAKLDEIGIIKDEGKIIINENRFSRHILKYYKFAYSKGNQFYLFEGGKWRFVDFNEMSRILRNFINSHYTDCWNESIEKRYISTLKREADFIDDFDIHRNFINLQNGMLNIDACDLTSHSPDFKSSIQIPLKYDPNAECPDFLNFLKSIFEGNQEIINVIQEIFGYCLSSNTSAQKAFIFYGRGANGKSILSKVLMRLIGEANVSTIPLSELEKPFARYQLVGKTLNLATENEVSAHGISTTHFKAIVGGDPITVEKKFEQSISYSPNVKMVFSLNTLPKTKDRSYGFQRRLLIIPFNRTFKDSDTDTINGDVLLNKLYEELPGILNFSLQGLQRLSANKFVFSKAVKIDDMLNDYLEEINPYFAFVDERIEEGQSTDRLFNDKLVEEFKRWCAENGHQNVTKSANMDIIREIRSAMKEKNINFEASAKKYKSGGRRYTLGIKFKSIIVRNEEAEKSFLETLNDPEFDSQFFQS